MNNQRVPSSSTIQPAIETLLFNDIIEEKSIILRDLMDQFLQVHPFSRFESEFNLFSRRVKQIASDGQHNGTSRTRHTMQMPSDIGAQTPSKPSESGRSQENNQQHSEPANTFKRPLAAEYKPRTTLTHNNQSNNITHTTNNLPTTLNKSKVKYLTKWSFNKKQIKSNKGNSKTVIILKGTLLAGDQITVLKKVHNAGILIFRKTKQIVKTENGLYHLIGPITKGLPNILYRACVELNGIPKIWRILANVSTTEVENNLNENMTRKGTIYNKHKVASHNNSGTKDLFGDDLVNDIDFRQQLTQLSTSRKPKAFEACHTPSQLLKHRFHQKYVKACLTIGSQKNTDELIEE